MKKTAEIISFILNPTFLILILILLGIEKSGFSQTELMVLTILALLMNGILPLCLFIYSNKKGLILDDILDNEEVLKNRPLFLGWGTVILLAETLGLYFFHRPQPLFFISTILFILILLAFLITFYKKISLHIGSVTTFCLIILFIFGRSFWPILFLIPLAFWSRLVLRRHTVWQMAAAFIIALLVISGIFYFYNPTS